MFTLDPHPPPGTTHHPPNQVNLKAWWNQFNFVPKTKKNVIEGPYREDHPVFGKMLKESSRYTSVQISTANADGDLYVWGYIPIVVAKCGLYLKENASEVPGTFRISGSHERMRELQAAFESPPRYGKSIDWEHESYTTHDVASIFLRYLTQMPEPVIPYDMYHLFRAALAKQPFNHEEAIMTYKSLIRRMPRANQYLLLYVLDLLWLFAYKSDKNLMTATNLAVIFRPCLLSHPQHEMSLHEHALSQGVLEFLIAQLDWFMGDTVPPAVADRFRGGADGGFGGAGEGGAVPSGGTPGGAGGTGKWREGMGDSPSQLPIVLYPPYHSEQPSIDLDPPSEPSLITGTHPPASHSYPSNSESPAIRTPQATSSHHSKRARKELPMLPSTSPSKPKSSSSRQLEIDLAPDPRNHRSSPHPSSDRHPPLVAASNSKLSPRTSSSNNVGIQSINCDRGVPILALSTSGSSSTSSLKSSSSSRTIKETDHTFPSKRESKLRDGHVGTHAGTNSKPAQWMASDATSVRSVTTASSISTNDHGLGEQGSFFKRLLKGRRAAVAASITSSTSRQSSDDDTWE